MPTRRGIGSLALVLLFVTGCVASSRRGHLYALRDGARASVVLHWSPMPRGKGSAEATLATGEHCRGTYATTPNDVSRGDENEIIEEQTQRGMLVLSCKNGALIKCDFSRDPSAGGVGSCKDSHGAEYSFVF